MNPIMCGYINLQEIKGGLTKTGKAVGVATGMGGVLTGGHLTGAYQSGKLQHAKNLLAKAKGEKATSYNDGTGRAIKNMALGAIPVIGAINTNRVMKKRKKVEGQLAEVLKKKK